MPPFFEKLSDITMTVFILMVVNYPIYFYLYGMKGKDPESHKGFVLIDMVDKWLYRREGRIRKRIFIIAVVIDVIFLFELFL